jgi:hypothetical protein
MCELTTIIMIGAAVTSAYAANEQGKTSKKIARNNQIMAEYAADDAKKKGEENAIAVRRKGDAIASAQRTRLAAAGLDLNVGTAADLVDTTNFFKDQDVATTRNNAARDAWGYRAQGANYRAQGDAAAANGQLSALGSVLGGAAQVSGQWDTYTRSTGTGG